MNICLNIITLVISLGNINAIIVSNKEDYIKIAENIGGTGEGLLPYTFRTDKCNNYNYDKILSTSIESDFDTGIFLNTIDIEKISTSSKDKKQGEKRSLRYCEECEKDDISRITVVRSPCKEEEENGHFENNIFGRGNIKLTNKCVNGVVKTNGPRNQLQGEVNYNKTSKPEIKTVQSKCPKHSLIADVVCRSYQSQLLLSVKRVLNSENSREGVGTCSWVIPNPTINIGSKTTIRYIVEAESICLRDNNNMKINYRNSKDLSVVTNSKCNDVIAESVACFKNETILSCGCQTNGIAPPNAAITSIYIGSNVDNIEDESTTSEDDSSNGDTCVCKTGVFDSSNNAPFSSTVWSTCLVHD